MESSQRVEALRTYTGKKQRTENTAPVAGAAACWEEVGKRIALPKNSNKIPQFRPQSIIVAWKENSKEMPIDGYEEAVKGN